MAITQSIFINEFQKGASENANIGIGTLVGIDTYSKKGVAQLTKDTTKVSGSIVTDLVTSFAQLDASTVFAQGDTGKVYKSIDGGATWTDISPNTLGVGQGIVVFDSVLYAFRAGNIDYLKTPYAQAGWVQGWQAGLATGGNVVTNYPFIFPNGHGFYFGNGNKVGGLFESVVGTAIDPANGATYNYSNTLLTLPSFYTINCLSFLPASQLMIGTGSGVNPQVADLFSWDTISTKFSAPLRLYATASGGIRQLINRNNILYAVTSGNQCIFETNGTTFNLVADISLRTNIRAVAGAQVTLPIFLFPRPYAIALLGNKLLSGMSERTVETPNGYFPAGVWSVAFTEEGQAVQCEYTISTGTVVATQLYDIGAVFPLTNGLASVGYALISWRDNSTYGIDVVEINNFQNNIVDVAIESEMLEIGTPLEPATVKDIQINLTRNLVAGQVLTVNARKSFDEDFVLVQSFNSVTDGSSTGYKITKNAIGSTRFVQLQIQMATGASTNRTLTPEIRNVIIN